MLKQLTAALIKNLLLITLLFASFPLLRAQIVNTERRLAPDSTRSFQGKTDFSFNITQSTQRITSVKNNLHLQRNFRENTYMLFSNLNFMSVDTQRYLNNGFFHFRYNYDFRYKWLTGEAFTQIQFNKIQQILRRFLWGGGFRYKIFNTEALRLSAGNSVMYEFEVYIDRAFNDLIRFNHYISAEWYFNKVLTLKHTTYFQPRADYFESFRINTETSAETNITKHLKLHIVFNLFYDTHPHPGVQSTFYTFTNGLTYIF